MQFFRFSDVFEGFLMRLDLFGYDQMQSDAFRCVGKRFDTSGSFEFFDIFRFFWYDFGDFWSVFGLGGLLLRTFYV